MRVFVYEYGCAQPPGAALPESVCVEGRAMLAALVEDFGRITGTVVETLRECPREAERERFQQLAGAADWTMVIAPEFDEILLERCRWVEETGGRLLGPGHGVVALAGDKWATYLLLDQHGVPTPQSWLADAYLTHPIIEMAFVSHGIVQKPRHGAGSQDVELFASDTPAPRPGFILQQYIPGQAASVAFLTGPASLVPFRPARQLLSDDGRFHYLGGSLPLPEPLAHRAVRLATEALRPLATLYGYVGVDLVLGDAPDGSRDYVIEINPRLTTSYIGLRALAEDNLAEVMLRVAEGREIPPIRWRKGSVEFEANGVVRFV